MVKKSKIVKSEDLPAAEENASPKANSQDKEYPTDAHKIWEEIKNLNINLFALPDQTVAGHCSPVMIEPNRLYLTTTASSVLVSLEEALNKSYEVTTNGKFIVISRK